MLQESLSRFANSTISNVGTARATCGLVGGIVIAFVGFLPPIAENFALSKNRWLRLLAVPGLWLGLTIVVASLHGVRVPGPSFEKIKTQIQTPQVCMMIYIFGDLRQLRSFELARPSISPPQRLRPFRNVRTSVRSLRAQPEPCLVPITRPPTIPKPVYDPGKTASSSISTPPIHILPPIPEPVPPSPLSPLSSNTGLRFGTTNIRATLTSVCSDSLTVSYDSDTSRTSTTSSDVGIHISEAFYDLEPPYLGNDMTTSSPVPSSWQGESPPITPSLLIPRRTSYHPDGPHLQGFPLPVDYRTSTTPEREEEKWMPTASFIRPFGYNEWNEWDDESMMYTTEGSLGGYCGGDEESRISHVIRPSSLRQYGQTAAVRTRVPIQLRKWFRRGTIASSEEPGSFDFDALPAFQAPASPTVVPTCQRRPRYRACDASPPPPLHVENSLIEAGRREGVLRTWLVDVPLSLVRRTQGRCDAVKQVMKHILSKSAPEVPRGSDGRQAYWDAPELKRNPHTAGEIPQDRGPNNLATTPQPPSHFHHTALEKGACDPRPSKGDWRVRWRRVLNVPAFKSPLTEILNPVVTRAQWEVVVKSGAFALAISLVVATVLVALPVP